MSLSTALKYCFNPSLSPSQKGKFSFELRVCKKNFFPLAIAGGESERKKTVFHTLSIEQVSRAGLPPYYLNFSKLKTFKL